MIAATLNRLDLSDYRRALFAGTAWGATLAIGLTAMSAWQCGIDAAHMASTAAICVAAGIVAIGPVAALRSRR